MASNTLTRLYSMPDGNLIQRADALHNSMTRDGAEFATRNVGAPERAAFMQARDAFSDFPDNEAWAGLLSVQIELKTEARADLEKVIRTIRNMAANALGERSGSYKTFRFEGVANLRDNDLPRIARRVLRMSAHWQTEVAAEGFNATHSARLSAALAAYETALDEVDKAEEARDLQTVQRILLGNTLWALMQRYARIGKSLFEDSDEAKYNDYFITG